MPSLTSDIIYSLNEWKRLAANTANEDDLRAQDFIRQPMQKGQIESAQCELLVYGGTHRAWVLVYALCVDESARLRVFDSYEEAEGYRMLLGIPEPEDHRKKKAEAILQLMELIKDRKITLDSDAQLKLADQLIDLGASQKEADDAARR